MRVLLALIALSLLAMDAPVRPKSNAAKAVHARLKKISTNVRTRYSSAPRKFVSSIRGAVSRGGHAGIQIFQQPLVPPEQRSQEQQPMRPNAPQEPGRESRREGRRRLLAIVKDEKLLATEGKAGSIMRGGDNATMAAHIARAGIGTNKVDRGGSEEDNAEKEISLVSAVIGVTLAVASAAFGPAANDATGHIVEEGGEWVSISAAAFLQCALLALPIFAMRCLLEYTHEVAYSAVLFGDVIPRGAVLGLALLVLPALWQPRRKETFRRGVMQRTVKSGTTHSLSQKFLSVLRPESGGLKSGSLYTGMLLSLAIFRRLGFASRGSSESLSTTSFFAAVILLGISWFESLDARGGLLDGGLRDSSRNLSGSDLSSLTRRSVVQSFRHVWRSIVAWLLWFAHGVMDLVSHARTNKASWQVLSFFLLQSGMAIVELIYANMTHAAGLISVSADNFFCTVALAVGLFAIRATSRNPTLTYSYGFSRLESVCGFANGIMLIYVAVLLVLEAFERLVDNDKVATGHTFTVCVFGMTGNVLGLYFFPPETRRENHNVQGIYLHIWANTLAFASMAISTAITAAVPAWEIVDIVTAAIVAAGVIALAVPLLIRSGRLLLLQVPSEKKTLLKSSLLRLNEIEGVVKVSGPRVWNLTPNCLVASVRLDVAEGYRGEDGDILFQARAVFASLGVHASQCTVQISRVETENPALIFFHKRSPSGLGETGIDLEALALAKGLREHRIARVEKSEAT